ncbi:DUF481 domain-containing protein [Pelagicoccus sp. SDUM812002]|uniref:DUF481 domain-containing protein n=1 Tax=Pelagicoccus sp. SDUM812002 TaxID=3041266 RepID=UPI00280E196C|nr:DUF481 domain-containing protein [Pelagicoccus sp. SDUM812002]MDQ8187626.1 DUF481 domain-containing protein [Pelagicoccus sp. SDUM812002]
MSKFFLSALLTIFVASSHSQDVQVILDNGDSLSGSLLSEDEYEIRISVDYLGEISLPQDRVAEVVRISSVEAEALQSPAKAIAETNIASTPEKSRVVKDVPAPDNVIEGSEEEDTSPARKRSFIYRIFAAIGDLDDEIDILPEWDKSLQFGLNSSSGRKDQSTQNYRLDMDREFESSRINIEAEYAYGEANGSVTRDRLSSSYRWRKDIGPGVFYESESDYFNDQIKLIDASLEQKFGLGTRFFDKEYSTLSAGLGASGRWRSIPETESEVEYLVSVFQDWDYRMSERIRLKQDFNIAMPLEDTEGYEINFSTAVTSALSKSVKFSIRYELGVDNSLAEELREDRRFISSLGYAF